MKNSHPRQVASREHISIHCCVSASGVAMPPMIIFKAAFSGGNYAAGGPDGALYGKQATGFMDSELFLRWFTQIFLVFAKPSADKPVLLLLDSHASHCSPAVIDCARQNNVILLALMPHTTHLCQPLDVAVYKSFKVALSKLVKLGQAVRGNLCMAKKNVPRIIKSALGNSMTATNIKSGFRKCRIHPFNPNAIEKSQLCRNQLIPRTDVDLSIMPENSPSQ